MNHYKHAVTVSSQLYFCSSPIRLDSYNKCQFGCVFCFSRKRYGDHAFRGLKTANTVAFGKRLERINSGVIQSGLDEFLQVKVPIQFGGMQDPFSDFEFELKTTLDLLKILKDHNYPTLISTKGKLFLKQQYLKILEKMNVYIRLSATGVAEKYRKSVDVNCDTFESVLRKIKLLSSINIPVSLRIQPVIPSFEKNAIEMTQRAAEAGASHVAFEYLKIPTENFSSEVKAISKAVKINIWELMNSKGVKRLGRDYTLAREAKQEFLSLAKKECRKMNLKFGAGDTEFIHLSEGDGCCNGSSYFVKGATQFKSNFVGVLKNRRDGELIFFDNLKKEWSPKKNIHQYLTTNSRSRSSLDSYTSWMSLLAHRWNGENGPYSPMLFSGVSWTGNYDNEGYKIYQFQSPL